MPLFFISVVFTNRKKSRCFGLHCHYYIFLQHSRFGYVSTFVRVVIYIFICHFQKFWGLQKVISDGFWILFFAEIKVAVVNICFPQSCISVTKCVCGFLRTPYAFLGRCHRDNFTMPSNICSRKQVHVRCNSLTCFR